MEGPSDRIYINKLLNLCSGNALKEGSHYSFVFYGGSIRAHFALENEWENFDEIENNETNEFIAMLPINRNAIMVADSDLITPNEQQKNLHKIRIAEEFKKCSSGFLWTTEGCTIENYVELEVYIRARQKVHPRSKFRAETDKFAKIAGRKKGQKSL